MSPGSIEAAFRAEQGAIFATLLRTVGDWQLAEDAVMDAFAAALVAWPRDGWPRRPGAWLTSTARRKAIDALRRRRTRAEHEGAVRHHLELIVGDRAEAEAAMGDDRLSLIFTCCHPALAPEARVALTLRYVAGLSTQEVARGFLVPEATLAKRLVRAKHKIAAAGVPYRVPGADERPDRLGAVCRVLYLVFNEGYAASRGSDLLRIALCEQAIALTELLGQLMPDEPEVGSLLALMLLTHSRRDARVVDGCLVRLAEQDRQRWHHEDIERGHRVLQEALRRGRPGPFALQACIASLHATAPTFEATDWPQIAALYEGLWRCTANPVVRLNQAVAVAMHRGPAEGLRLIDDDVASALRHNHLLWSTRGELLARLGLAAEALHALDRALELVRTEPERRFLKGRREALAG